MILASKEDIKQYTDAGYWGEITLMDMFKENVGKNPDREFLVDAPNKEDLVGLRPERLSCKETDRIVDTLATSFLKMGVKKDDVVVIQLPNIVEMPLTYLALWRIGAIPSPVPIQWRSHELDYIFPLTGAKVFITLEEFGGFKHIEVGRKMQEKHSFLKEVISLEQLKGLCEGDIDPEGIEQNTPTANDIATVCYTSGTEAAPKACPLSHNNWIFQGGIISQTALAKEGSRMLLPSPLVNMTAFSTMFVPVILHNGGLVLHHPFDVELYMKQLIEENITGTVSVPAMLVMLLKHPDIDNRDFSNLQFLITGSAPPPIWTLEEFKRRWDIDILNGWGQNEGTVLTAGILDIPDMDTRTRNFPGWGRKGYKSPVKRSEGIVAKIVDVDTNTELTEPGEVGELAYKGPGTMPCYFRQPEYTEASFDEQGLFHTGDLFEVRPNNLVGFFDRKKDIIIRGGQNISAAEVENIAKAHTMVLDAAAVDMPDEKLGEKVCLYVVPQDGHLVTLESMSSFMKDEGIAIYKHPQRIEMIDVIPRNPLGKVVKPPLRKDIRKKLEKEA